MLTATMSLWDEEERISRAELRLRCRTFSRMSEAECLRLCLVALPVISPAKERRPRCSSILQCNLCCCLYHCEYHCAKRRLESSALRLSHHITNSRWAKRGKYKLSVHQKHLMEHHGNRLQSRQWEADGADGANAAHTHTYTTHMRLAACK